MKAQREQPRGFTLIELLIVVGIVVVLAALLLPVFQSARARAKETTCISNLHQIGMAFQMYMADHTYHPPRLYSLYPRYISDKQLFVCPSDDWDAQGGWGWAGWGAGNTPPEKWPFPISYGYFFSTPPDPLWKVAESMSGRPGYAVCVLHGTPFHAEFTEPGRAPHYTGRTLRLCFDGSVIMREVPGNFNAWKLMTDQDKTPGMP